MQIHVSGFLFKDGFGGFRDYESEGREFRLGKGGQLGCPLFLSFNHCLGKGIDKEDPKEIVRGKQAPLLFEICYVLEDQSLPKEEDKNLTWSLFQTAEDGNPVTPICPLHESVLESDPTGG